MHVDVGEQGADDAALRRPPRTALSTRHAPPAPLISLLDGRLQPHLEEMQHVPVHHAAGDTLQQLLVRNGVEIFRQVGVDHIRVAVAQRVVYRPDRVLRAPLRSIPIGTVVEVCFKAARETR